MVSSNEIFGGQSDGLPDKPPGNSKKFELRQATESDFPAIKSLIRQVQINPMGLHWQNFLIAVDSQGRMVGCGQVKTHQDGSFELASIAVVNDWRRQGIASRIIRQLLEAHPKTLYLTCRAELGTFYQPFGFQRIEVDEMPPYFRRISRLVSFFNKSGLIQDTLLVMRRTV